MVPRNSYSKLTENDRQEIIDLFKTSKNNSAVAIASITNFTETTINKVIDDYIDSLKSKPN